MEHATGIAMSIAFSISCFFAPVLFFRVRCEAGVLLTGLMRYFTAWRNIPPSATMAQLGLPYFLVRPEHDG
jgi:hypothetical protein